MQPIPRTAVLTPWFADGFAKAGAELLWDKTRWERGLRNGLSSRNEVRIFPEGWNAKVIEFAPAALAGTFAQLRMASSWVTKGGLPSLTRALIVLERPESPRLRDIERDWLWNAFGLPIFQQLIGAEGQLLATECEAHEGLHVRWATEGAGPPLPQIEAPAAGLHFPGLHFYDELDGWSEVSGALMESSFGAKLAEVFTATPGKTRIVLNGEPCPCGRSTPRILLAPLKLRLLQRAAGGR